MSSTQFIGFVGDVDPLVTEQFHEANLHVVELKKLSFFPIVENKKHLLVFDFKKQSVQKGEIDLLKTLLKEKVALLFLHHAENDAVIKSLFEGVSLVSPPSTAGSTIVQLSHESGVSEQYKAKGYLPLAATHIPKSDIDPKEHAILVVRQLNQVNAQLLQYPNGDLIADSKRCPGIFYYSYTNTLIFNDSLSGSIGEVAVTYHLYKENGVSNNAYTLIVQVKRGSITPTYEDTAVVQARLGVQLKGTRATPSLASSSPNDRAGIVTPTFVSFKQDIKYVSDGKPAVFNAVYKTNVDVFNWGCHVTTDKLKYSSVPAGGVAEEPNRYYFDFFGREPWNISSLPSISDLHDKVEEKVKEGQGIFDIFPAASYAKLNWEGGQVWDVEATGEDPELAVILSAETLTVKAGAAPSLSTSALNQKIIILLK